MRPPLPIIPPFPLSSRVALKFLRPGLYKGGEKSKSLPCMTDLFDRKRSKGKQDRDINSQREHRGADLPGNRHATAYNKYQGHRHRRPVGARVFRAVVRQSRVAPAESSKWPRLAFRYKQTQSPARQIQRSVLGPKGAAAATLNRRRCWQENASAGPARRKGIETRWKERRGPSRYREAASLGLRPDTLSRVPAVELA